MPFAAPMHSLATAAATQLSTDVHSSMASEASTTPHRELWR